jgi:hypothetical protein
MASPETQSLSKFLHDREGNPIVKMNCSNHHDSELQ